jgi:hypothetical protein
MNETVHDAECRTSDSIFKKEYARDPLLSEVGRHAGYYGFYWAVKPNRKRARMSTSSATLMRQSPRPF